MKSDVLTWQSQNQTPPMTLTFRRRQKNGGQKKWSSEYFCPHFSAFKSLSAFKNCIYFACNSRRTKRKNSETRNPNGGVRRPTPAWPRRRAFGLRASRLLRIRVGVRACYTVTRSDFVNGPGHEARPPAAFSSLLSPQPSSQTPTTRPRTIPHRVGGSRPRTEARPASSPRKS